MKMMRGISVGQLRDIAIKGTGAAEVVVDVSRKIVLVSLSSHQEGKVFLLQHGSEEKYIWGINLYPEHYGHEDFIGYDAIINLNPHGQNPSRYILNKTARERIKRIIDNVVCDGEAPGDVVTLDQAATPEQSGSTATATDDQHLQKQHVYIR